MDTWAMGLGFAAGFTFAVLLWVGLRAWLAPDQQALIRACFLVGQSPRTDSELLLMLQDDHLMSRRSSVADVRRTMRLAESCGLANAMPAEGGSPILYVRGVLSPGAFPAAFPARPADSRVP